MVYNGFHLLKGNEGIISKEFVSGYENRPVSFTRKGSINATDTRIDFSNSNWINQFDDIKLAVKKIHPLLPGKLSDWVKKWLFYGKMIYRANGVSKGIFSKSHSIVSNVCFTKQQTSVIFHEVEPSIMEEARAYQMNETFYSILLIL